MIGGHEFNTQQGQNMTSELTQRSVFYIGDPDVICLSVSRQLFDSGVYMPYATAVKRSNGALIGQYTTNWVASWGAS